MREKFTNVSTFFVREVGRGSGVLERSLHIVECCEGEEGDDGLATGSRFAHILEKKIFIHHNMVASLPIPHRYIRCYGATFWKLCL